MRSKELSIDLRDSIVEAPTWGRVTKNVAALKVPENTVVSIL
jgi:hypothetical protein